MLYKDVKRFAVITENYSSSLETLLTFFSLQINDEPYALTKNEKIALIDVINFFLTKKEI